MLDLNEVKKSFPSLINIVPLSQASGQRDVCSAELNGKKVALKIFRKSERAEDRLNREVVAISKLGSGFVPKIYDFGKIQIASEERLFIIEEWIDGQLLSDLLSKKKHSFQEVLDFCFFMLRACADFESKKLVHRDIKPNNLMIKGATDIFILDFGIVRHLDLASLTETAHMFGLGTFGYSAPEQMRNIKVNINTRADLFSVGVVAYEMSTGQNPYLQNKNGNPLLVIQHMEKQNLPPLSLPEDVNGEFSEFIASLTDRFPSRRPQTANEALTWFGPIYSKLNSASEDQ